MLSPRCNEKGCKMPAKCPWAHWGALGGPGGLWGDPGPYRALGPHFPYPGLLCYGENLRWTFYLITRCKGLNVTRPGLLVA